MNDVRSVCAGLCLPEIESLSLREALLSSVDDHERRTRTSVLKDVSDLPVRCAALREDLRLSIHPGRILAMLSGTLAAGANALLLGPKAARSSSRSRIKDRASRLQEGSKRHRVRLGLTGLWDRIESLGGVLDVSSRPNRVPA